MDLDRLDKMDATEFLKQHDLIESGKTDLIISKENKTYSLCLLLDIYHKMKEGEKECDHPYMSIIGEEARKPECLACGKKLY